jgi:pantetheine-phosphate adenylyltransferase
MANVQVEGFKGLLVDYVKSRGSRIIVRGLRAVSDYEYEAQMALMNRKISKEVETVFLMTSEDRSSISASAVRDIARHGGDVSKFVPRMAAQKLKEVFA